MSIKIASNLIEHARGALESSEHASVMDTRTLAATKQRCENNQFTHMTPIGPQFLTRSERRMNCSILAEHRASKKKIEVAAESAVFTLQLGMWILSGLSKVMKVEQPSRIEQVMMVRKLAVKIYIQNERDTRIKRQQRKQSVSVPRDGSLADIVETMANTIIGLATDEQYGPNGELISVASE